MNIDIQVAAVAIQQMFRLQKLKQKISSNQYAASVKVVFEPPTSPNHDGLANALGMPSRELEILFDAIFANPDEDEIEALKRVVFLAKLRRPEPVLKYRAQYDQAKEFYENRLKNKQAAQAQIDDAQAEIDELLKDNDFTQQSYGWAKVIDSLQKTASAHNYVPSALPTEARRFAWLLTKKSKHAKIKDGKLDFNWSQLESKLNPQHIADILKAWGDMQDQLDEFLVYKLEADVESVFLHLLAEEGFVPDEL